MVLPPGALHALFEEGAITIQDESSQLVTPTLELRGDEKVLDACSAPGGKTMHIASYLTTGQVTALDLYEHKLALIKENAQRLGVADKVITKKLDARKVFETFGADAFDKILYASLPTPHSIYLVLKSTSSSY